MEPLPTKKRWRLLSNLSSLHGHQFDTEGEAKAWIAQPYVAGSYSDPNGARNWMPPGVQ